ncbi:conserved Plasmodium protein, unknown function [Plasmodium berghei]|uniref:EF-hand domain-containing protein n=2 Tax=Plasmodium berghei TaxID=5821 RepID=A0A509ARY9_PLABA|nr:conserved Plasmodium protein, unknown function [Plasmodium berghei ANKA]CXJ23183.1 conserved Plasmodium protein, unknown function [Plasmodium berghei]SCM26713.1 conserved Plasmodium protein, unknown function [Plasmodium berghei]SCN28598.1 conserved Plasmodium protein, unknown function [Plasmodium berghei]SCO62786.1 conserved Plasmodium protein, unknown function [Plasmodium berghei]SCO64346.1 conserved Plasmodium protein, unknown function [Plasmodium berghei]|eukprot:XP_034424242.1 conserved Plasmodium protein, unknown function [Plasmodium berghei ANKA]
MEIDLQCLIRALKYFTKTEDGELNENDINIIFNKILSQNMKRQDIKELIKNIKSSMHENRSNYIDDYILIPSMLNILINTQLAKCDMNILFKDLFSCIQKNGEIDKDSLKTFLNLCNNNSSNGSSLCLDKFHFNSDNLSKGINYEEFVNIMRNYLKEA